MNKETRLAVCCDLGLCWPCILLQIAIDEEPMESIAALLSVERVDVEETLQTLWSGYGEILRVRCTGGEVESAIVKRIEVPSTVSHPRGWTTERSHARKLRSYQVEQCWYQDWAPLCDERCRAPCCFGSFEADGVQWIVLEDLDAAGFGLRKEALSFEEAEPCLRWLAAFHAKFLGARPGQLWPVGTYWHLATRPDELNAMEPGVLRDAAALIDARLNEAHYQTIVHGDAKVANFCFAKDWKGVAAVDFQYVGGGCGIKDVVYFLGSCFDEDACAEYESVCLAAYFEALQDALLLEEKEIDFSALESEWRALYAWAWTDFTRFLLGWMPGHRKLNRYSERLASEVLGALR